MNLNFKAKTRIREIVEPWFEDHGYQFNANGYGEYVKFESDWICSIKFDFYSKSDKHSNSTLQMHSKLIEGHILSIGLANFNLTEYKAGKYFLSTIEDRESIQLYKQQRDQLDLSKDSDVLIWGNQILNYMQKEGAAFYDQYKSIQNIHSKMQLLERSNSKNYSEILVGGISHIFRALIISKLCNATEHNSRIEKWDKIILENTKYKHWHIYYEKLKDKLDEIDQL